VALELAVDVTTLGLLSGGGELQGEWEIGGLLYRIEDGKGVRELAARSTIRLKSDERPGLGRAPGEHPEAIVVHRRVEQRLKPGTWRLTGFARDSTMRMFGADDRSIVLPKVRSQVIVGPIVRSAHVSHVVSAFPLVQESKSAPPSTAVPGTGAVPLLPSLGDPESEPAEVRLGEDVELVSWLCGDRRPVSADVAGELLGDGGARTAVSLSRRIEKQGRCLRVSDRVATSDLAPGVYVYRVTSSPDDRPTFAEKRLAVLPRASGISDHESARAR
jgi:hypothetical protein